MKEKTHPDYHKSTVVMTDAGVTKMEQLKDNLGAADITMSAEDLARLDKITMRALSRSPSHRYATAREMAVDIERAFPVASARDIGEWVSELASDSTPRAASSSSPA